jgi:hypothetical protein
MNFEKTSLERLYTVGDVVLWVGWFLVGGSIVGAISYYFTPLVPHAGLAGMAFAISAAFPYFVGGVIFVLAGGAFRAGDPWGRVAMMCVALLIEVPLLYAWYLWLLGAAAVSSTYLIMVTVLSLAIVAPVSFLVYVAVRWLQTPSVVAAFEQGALAQFEPEEQ